MTETFGRYTLLRRLAVGGMAEIFLAALHGDAGFEKRLVVKRILPHLSADAAFVKMFIDEAIVAARLSHPNIIQTHDFGVVDGSHYIAMEYVEGVDLNCLLGHGRPHSIVLQPAQVAALGERIARGLGYTHNLADDTGEPAGIVHRDISPHNVMISFTGEVKVMDFGIAKAAARSTQTAAGTIKGKLAYMAPEQAAGQSATKHSDQFALGVVLWECLTGTRLFVSDSEIQLIARVKACDIPPLRRIRADVPKALEVIIMRALHKDPARRYPDVEEMHDALMAFRYSLGSAGIVQLGPLARACERTLQAQGSWSWAHAGQASPGMTRPLNVPPLPAPPLSIAVPAQIPIPQAAPPPEPSPAAPSPCEAAAWLDCAQIATIAPDARPHSAQASVAATEIGQLSGRSLRGLLPPNMVKRPIHIGRRLRRKAPPLKNAVLRSHTWRRWLIPSALSLCALGCLAAVFWHQSVVASRLAELHAPQISMTALRIIGGHRPQTGRLSLSYEGHEVDVYLGKHCLGTTPLANEVVPAGNLALRLVNESAGITQCYEITVPAGGSARGSVGPIGPRLPVREGEYLVPGMPLPLHIHSAPPQPSAT